MARPHTAELRRRLAQAISDLRRGKVRRSKGRTGSTDLRSACDRLVIRQSHSGGCSRSREVWNLHQAGDSTMYPKNGVEHLSCPDMVGSPREGVQWTCRLHLYEINSTCLTSTSSGSPPRFPGYANISLCGFAQLKTRRKIKVVRARSMGGIIERDRGECFFVPLALWSRRVADISRGESRFELISLSLLWHAFLPYLHPLTWVVGTSQ